MAKSKGTRLVALVTVLVMVFTQFAYGAQTAVSTEKPLPFKTTVTTTTGDPLEIADAGKKLTNKFGDEKDAYFCTVPEGITEVRLALNGDRGYWSLNEESIPEGKYSLKNKMGEENRILIECLDGDRHPNYALYFVSGKQEAQESGDLVKVNALIAALPESSAVIEKQRADVEEARAEYNKLTKEEKGKVENYSRLTEAEKVLAELDRKYIGVDPGENVPESFTNDLWLQYDFMEMGVGATADLTPRRVEEAITDYTGNNVELPHFNYEIIKGSSVEIDDKINAHAVVKGVKPGVSIVKVTYDALEHKDKKHFPACDPVNTAYVVYSIGANPQIEIKDNIVYDNPGEGEILFRSYDTVYFTEGYKTDFPVQVSQTGAEKLEVFCNGIPVEGKDGTYVLPLENRSNIIEMRGTAADGTKRSLFRVLDARKIEINVKNLTHPGKEIVQGDRAEISFRGITMPVYKLATIYNPCMAGSDSTATHVYYKDNYGKIYRGGCNQYDLATKNSFQVDFRKEGTYTFSSGKIFSEWWGDKLGSDKVKDGPGKPNLNASSAKDYFSFMPDFTVDVNYSPEYGRTQALTELESYKNPEEYKEEQQKEIREILEKAEAALEKAETKEAVDEIVSNAKAELNVLPTAKELEQQKEMNLSYGSAELTHKDFKEVKGGYKITATGKHINARPVVKDINGKKLEEGKDYTVSYSSEKRVNPGKYTVTVTGNGDYTGEFTFDFIITPAGVKNGEGRLSKLKGGYDDAVITWNKAKGASGYSVAYRSRGKSKWTSLGRTTKTQLVKENLYDGRTYEFKITPYYKADGIRYMSSDSELVKVTTLKKVNLKSVKKAGNGKVSVKWDNIAGERGYQISKSTKKNGTDIVYTYKTTKGNNKTLKAAEGKGYYYKVRAYQVVDGKKIVAPWSDAKYCRVK